MNTSNSNPTGSYFESVTGRTVNPVWFLRIFPMFALACLVLALFVWKSGGTHDFCIGLAAGTLVGTIAQAFAITRVELNDDPQRSDVDRYPLT
jgi:uncharacterized membrane protein YdjX (TVP38/TMEM64 family)